MEPEPRTVTPLSAPPMREALALLRARYGAPQLINARPPVDELVLTILSQHTSDINAERAYVSLRTRFPTWREVRDAPLGAVVDAIRSGGLAERKALTIQTALRDIERRAGALDLALLSDLSVEEARDWLTELAGVGPKTASCVLLFSLGMPAMPVDTHVNRVGTRLGWLRPGAPAATAHVIFEREIAAVEIYATHMLLIRHGRQTCKAQAPRCRACVLVQCCPSARGFLSSERTGHDDPPH